MTPFFEVIKNIIDIVRLEGRLEGVLREHSYFTSAQAEFWKVATAFQNFQIEIVTLEYGATLI